MKRTPIGLALVALLTLSTVPARGATLTVRDGSQVNGEIRGVVVQRLSVQHQLPEKGLLIEQHLYALTRGPDLVWADEEGLVRSRAVAGQLMTTTRRALEVEGDGESRRWSAEWAEPDDAAILTAAMTGRKSAEVEELAMAGESALLPPPPAPAATARSALEIVGQLQLTDAGWRFDPAITVSGPDGERRVPVEQLAAGPGGMSSGRARPEPRAGVMKVRAEGSAAGEYRLVAVEAENTGRPTVPSHLACGEARPGLYGGGPGSVWHFRCEMETSTGIGFNLALVAASIFIVDDQGRELQTFERLSAGFEGPPGAPGYVEFLALGPADSRAVTVYYGDGSIRVPME